ncbi:CaiB/baiF CoA-transferase family protein [Cyphellophora attinorum]|uniref:CaiB/baiF CoA-transferase family protein n=1 Tax=Cyphellophora attinorum TaxID=1664694 RepID=A0A0N0NK65_9EURO|nr:CaiB/baiF CoA-transferase family protein [Phialophora attinorum]KPI37688.1 CaiB/baiF CoA-transferase family protein [Phialophora attinorum]
MSEFNILTPNAMLGYGFKLEQFWYGIEKYKPKAIIVDSGSTDGGPYKLGLNKMTCGKGSYVRDLTPLLEACYHRKIKVLIGSVGGDGSTKHVAEMLEIVTEITRSKGFAFKVATIDAGIDRDFVKSRIRVGRVGPCGPVEDLSEEAVDRAVDVVAQMGAEPFLEALKGDPDIILGGRAYDPAPFAAFSMFHGVQPAIGWHMGKIMECGGICAVPKGRSMIATMRADSFDLTPLAPNERCTPLSVASHTLYEKTRPDRLPGPGGILNLDGAEYVQLTEKTLRVKGATFESSPVYQIKLEGVEKLGYRTIFIGGIRDPILISQIDDFLEGVRKYTQNLFPELDKSDQCRLIFHIYGRDAVMGPLEPAARVGHEIGVLGEVVAESQELSHTIANNARASILHMPYEGQIATTGNFASPLSPHETHAGPVFKFSLYHLVDLEPEEELSLFPTTYHSIGDNTSSASSAAPFIEESAIAALEAQPLTPLSFKTVPKEECDLVQVARIIRSKNSGPFELTIDVMCDTKDAYERLKAADILNNEAIQKLYHLRPEDIITNMYFAPALAWKCTFKRPWAQGSVGERDTLGTQQHAPLLGLRVPPMRKGSPAKLNGTSVLGATTKEPSLNGVHMNGVNGMHKTNGSANGAISNRQSFTAIDSLEYLWTELGLPKSALQSAQLPGDGLGLPSSFKIAHLAQASIGLTALLAGLLHSVRTNSPVPKIAVPLLHAAIEFKSERLYSIDGKPAPSPWGPIGGLHTTADGYVRLHDSFPNHRDGAKALLGCSDNAERKDIAKAAKKWKAVDLEATAFESELVISALRSYDEWDCLPQSRAIADFPISIKKIADGPPTLPEGFSGGADKALRGLRVIDMSRVIAAPLAGKTLAVHGADVLWITSPNLPDLPTMDRDFGRGKRTAQVDLQSKSQRSALKSLLREADVFIQGYRPGSLASKGLSAKELASDNSHGIVVANMSAYGPTGPWSGRRGFDSLVQTCSGMNVSEAEHAGKGEVARPTPCQALDHAGGYFLAAGIMAALYKKATEGGSYEVHVSLAGTMKYLRSLGQFPGDSGFQCQDYDSPSEVADEFMETRESGFGQMRSVKHSASVEGVKVGWDVMPKPLGSDELRWL